MTTSEILLIEIQGMKSELESGLERAINDEIVDISIEKRRAKYRNDAAREEMRNVVENANVLDQTVSKYKINSTFETASGTTSVEIENSKSDNKNSQTTIIAVILGVVAIIGILAFVFLTR